MKHLGKVLEQTSWLGVSNTLNNNSDTLYEAITQLENVTIKNAGYFLSEDALKKAVPNPTMGMIAYVRDVNSGVYYIWNTYLKDNVPTWTGTTTTVPEPNISMDAIEGLEASVQGVVDKQDELTNRVNTNSNDIGGVQTTVNTYNTKFSLVDDKIEVLQHDKQDKLAHYTEEDENATIATRETISLHTEQQVGTASISIDATTSEVEMSSTNHNSEHARVRLNNGNISIDADVKVSMSCDSGETVIEDVVGALVSNANAIATLTGTEKGSVSKTVTDEIAKIVDSAPEAFDTLKEIADYITEDMSGAEEIVTSLGALNLRVYELGDFATAKDAEDKAREPIYSGSDNISIIHYTINRSTDGLILQHQDVEGGYHRSVQTLFYHSRQYVRFVWFTDSTRTVLLENANFNRDWWETSISHLEYDKTTHTIKCRRIGQDVNSAKWITLPSASTSTDGLMTMEQVKSLEGKQDALQTYEETTGKAEVKIPNGNSYVRVTKDGVGMYAQDGKSGILNSSSGSRLVYMKTATDSSGSSYTSHRDDISIGKHDGNSATHITMTSKSTTEEAGEKLTNTSTIQVNPEGISMSSPNGEVGDIVKEISGKASSESVNELRQEVEEKAPKSGYAPDLKVNFAKELVGRGESTPEVIGEIRPTGVRSIGDGNATIERIKGESVVWNQFAPVISPSTVVPISTKVAQYTYDQDKVTITTIQEISNDYSAAVKITYLPHIANHKYLIQFCAEAQNVKLYVKAITSKNVNGKQNIAAIYRASADDNAYEPYIAITGGSAIGSTLEISNISWYDLTLMFGSGNEPKTIEEFEARKPLGVTNEYNEGTIVSYDGSALKSVGFNAWDEEWEVGKLNVITGVNEANNTFKRSVNYTELIKNTEYRCVFTNGTSDSVWIMFFDLNGSPIEHKVGINQSFNLSNVKNKSFVTPNQDCKVRFYVKNEPDSQVCIHLAHTYNPERYPNGYAPYEADTHSLPDVTSILDANGNKLFPYGLLSAGSVHDEITATKAIKRVGVVDMGTLSWNYTADKYSKFSTKMPNDAVNYSLTIIPNMLNSLYQSQRHDAALLGDKNMWRAAEYIGIYDSSYTSTADFKAAMSGVLLYYELAEPIEVDLPEPLNMTYEAWDFGTEELVAKGATTPLNADIVYQFNAVDRIRENSSATEALEEHVEERKDDGIELLTNGNLKLTLKGETREFMPATPSGDPMHWAYVSAGAEYNATDDYTLKDAPWKDMVDTIEDKAKWGLDVVDASRVKQMTIKGVEYNYATENRTSPEGGTYDRYFIVGQSNGVWVEDETKVLHLPKCWFLNGLGDITHAEMRSIYAVKHMSYALFGGFAGTPCRTFIDRVNFTGSDLNYGERYHRCKIVESIYSNVHRVANGGFNYAITSTTALRYFLPAVTLISYKNNIYGNFGDASLRVIYIGGVRTNAKFHSKYISKLSVKYMIDNATPTSAITITLHADAYARLKDDADIVAALAAKTLVTLVSA